MKSIKVAQFFVALGCATILFSCKKDDKKETPTPVLPEVPVVPDSTYIVSKAYYYGGDSTQTVKYADTVYYSNNRISKIAGVYGYNAGNNDSLNYEFTYNTAGKITMMTSRGTGWLSSAFNQDYHFYYNAGNQLDSFRMQDNTQWGGNTSLVLSYDEKKQLRTATFFGRNEAEPVENGHYDFKWNANGIVDSIVYNLTGPYAFGADTTALNAVKDTAVQFSEAYNMALAVRQGFTLISMRPSPNFYRLLMPSGYYFAGGTYLGYPVRVSYTKNGLGLLNSYWYDYNDNYAPPASTTQVTIKFEYIKVPKG